MVFLSDFMARGVGFEPTRPFGHRLSRPAPYQARAIPPCFRQTPPPFLVMLMLPVACGVLQVICVSSGILGYLFAGRTRILLPAAI